MYSVSFLAMFASPEFFAFWRHSCESGNPAFLNSIDGKESWIPAFTGMTGFALIRKEQHGRFQ
jgi:hypothetical protein